jgi:hypothetical protein
MFEKYKDGDLITLKLMHGEEVIGTLMQGPQGLAFGTFFSTADQDKDISLAKDKIQCISVVNDKISAEYKKVFTTVVVPDKPKIIV